MHAMMLKEIGKSLEYVEIPTPKPSATEILVKISACGICRTDLHVVDGELKHPKLPLIPGHQIVGKVVKCGNEVHNIEIGQRVGIPWLGKTDGCCDFCLHHQENLCDNAQFTGYQIDGGFAEYCVAESFLLPNSKTNTQMFKQPLYCCGFIGYRAYRKTQDAKRIGLYGFRVLHILLFKWLVIKS